MLELQSFCFNPFQENTYVIYEPQGACWIIDPGMQNAQEEAQLISFIEKNQLKPQAIVNTHAHIDHILGVQFLKNRFKIPFMLHAKDEPVLKAARTAAMMFGVEWKEDITIDERIEAGKKMPFGEEELVVLFVPGHSPGSVAFYNAAAKWVIGGDVLFAGSIGRTDLPGGNHQQLLDSVRTQLFTLPDETTVYSGHGPTTTIGTEKKSNPFF